MQNNYTVKTLMDGTQAMVQEPTPLFYLFLKQQLTIQQKDKVLNAKFNSF